MNEVVDAVFDRLGEMFWLRMARVNVVVGERPYSLSLPGVPRVGDIVHHSIRRAGKPKRFVVQRVEWHTDWNKRRLADMEPRADVFVIEATV